MIKKQRLKVLFTSDVMKKVYLKGWFTRHQICPIIHSFSNGMVGETMN